ncbi:hypothetical protein K7X08_017634 [Anisodus acutangulus]|uniref:Uncharacterized protein n=1 Tax=Anisodus acutangulus TaxID=402998 RepID=A0A9Q1LWB8_9SOLA|nr:hypothetical protein K7X08_017634 [Anisodus acutangulus]
MGIRGFISISDPGSRFSLLLFSMLLAELPFFFGSWLLLLVSTLTRLMESISISVSFLPAALVHYSSQLSWHSGSFLHQHFPLVTL